MLDDTRICHTYLHWRKLPQEAYLTLLIHEKQADSLAESTHEKLHPLLYDNDEP